MQKNDDFTKELRANKALFDSAFSSDEKVDAFRKQSIILDEVIKSRTESNMIASFEEQFNMYDFNKPYKEYIDGRKKNLDSLLHSVPRRYSAMSLSVDEYLREHKSWLEPECSGRHRSCLKDEVKADDLKVFQNILGKIPSAGIIDTSSKKIPWSLDSRPENDSGTSTLRPSTLNLFKGSAAQNQLKLPSFRTAREEMVLQNMKKNSEPSTSRSLFNYGASKKSLGARRNVRSGFVPPIRQEENASPTGTPPDSIGNTSTEPTDERLRGIAPKMIELITNEIMHKYQPIGWSDIAGLEYAKATIKEAVVWPLLRPDIFTGLRRPPRGILLFGPPGTGKTLIGKCIASQSKATFFSISASSLTSKWIGDGEKMVRALFAVAAVHQPSVVFIDEIDSLLSQRSNTEHESSRRLKTEFLVQLDGANTTGDERILIVGATNRPHELDEAARRRLVRRLYIPLPELSARIQILTNLLETVRNSIGKEEIVEIGNLTEGYSGADMEALCREASMEPIRSIPPDDIPYFSEDTVRPVTLEDFTSAVSRVRASVSQSDLQQYADWDRMYGAGQ